MRILMLMSVCLLFAATPSASQDAHDPFEILQKIDSNMVFKSAYAEMEMVITIKNRKIIKELKSYSVGNERSFIEFLSPARDRGTKIMKKDGVIKIYYPSAERVMRLSGHMLRQSMMGSDMSYEDMTERSKKLREEYAGEMHPDDVLNGRNCFVMTLTSRDQKQTYYKRKIWVDKDKHIGLREELYSKSGKLIKVLNVTDIRSFENRYYPVEMTMEDKLRKDSSTRIIIKKIDFNIDIPADTFSERMLMK